MAAEASDAALDGGEIWRDMADMASRWRDMARYGDIWRDMARYAALIVAAAAASSASSNHVGVVATQAAVVRHETPGPRSPALGMCDTSTQRTSTAQILADPVRAERGCTSKKQEALQASCSPGCEGVLPPAPDLAVSRAASPSVRGGRRGQLGARRGCIRISPKRNTTTQRVAVCARTHILPVSSKSA